MRTLDVFPLMSVSGTDTLVSIILTSAAPKGTSFCPVGQVCCTASKTREEHCMTTLKRLCRRLSLVLNWKILTVWAKKYGQVSFSPEPGSGNGFCFYYSSLRSWPKKWYEKHEFWSRLRLYIRKHSVYPCAKISRGISLGRFLRGWGRDPN